MGSPWEIWDDSMPPLVDANGPTSQAPRMIPPPAGATTVPSRHTPHTAPPNTPQYPWGAPFPQPHDPYGTWRQYYDTAPYPQNAAPSPYIPRQPLHPEMPSHDPFSHPRRSHSMPNPQPTSRKGSISAHKHSPWPSHADLSPLDLPARMPDTHMFTPRAPDLHTPSSSLSQSGFGSSAPIPPGIYHERPQQWRSDFKFKSGFASMFRNKSNAARSVDSQFAVPFQESSSTAKLDLHPFLRYSRSRPMTIYDLRREPLTLVFRELNRPPYSDDMDHSVTYPPTKYMRVYHSRLPWYIDIQANGASYISLADFFQQLFTALGKQISKHDFYNGELDDEDREVLTHAYLERCRSEIEKMEGVKKVDFLRGKFEWMGLSPGKNGMWRLKTG